jgi:hypothetical protein
MYNRRMIQTFKFAMFGTKFNAKGDAVLGEVPAGRIVKAEPIFEGGKPFYLIEVDTEAEDAPPIDVYAADFS